MVSPRNAGIWALAAVLVLVAPFLTADPAKAYNIKMRRVDMPDITDIPSMLSSVTNGGMTDQEKAKALWRLVFQYSHQESPPTEKITGNVHDAAKLFNVYGYRMCCCSSAWSPRKGWGWSGRPRCCATSAPSTTSRTW